MSRPYGYDDEFRRQRQTEEAEREKDQQERIRQNAIAGKQIEAGLEAKREAERQDREARIDAELEPEKQRLQRQWLADHPDKTARDFNTHAWPLLRANILEQHKAATFEATRQQLLRSGQYGI